MIVQLSLPLSTAVPETHLSGEQPSDQKVVLGGGEGGIFFPRMNTNTSGLIFCDVTVDESFDKGFFPLAVCNTRQKEKIYQSRQSELFCQHTHDVNKSLMLTGGRHLNGTRLSSTDSLK